MTPEEYNKLIVSELELKKSSDGYLIFILNVVSSELERRNRHKII